MYVASWAAEVAAVVDGTPRGGTSLVTLGFWVALLGDGGMGIEVLVGELASCSDTNIHALQEGAAAARLGILTRPRTAGPQVFDDPRPVRSSCQSRGCVLPGEVTAFPGAAD
jgi:hypothetical protein